ncbi:MAG: 50S ribosomal protein L10 [Candidatus Woesearchaeota archaeon]
MSHVATYKKDVVAKIQKCIIDFPIVGVVNVENLPAPQLQRMRQKLRERVVLFMAKKRLMKIALENAKENKPGVERLAEAFTGMPAMIFTKENPFSLFKVLKQNKSNAPAKAGQLAPHDIVVSAGPTSFAPGPIIGELGQFGIKTQVESGKITVKQDTVVCRQGQPIKDKLAALLVRLGIEPMEVGLDLTATYEDGVIFKKDVLDIDEDQFMARLVTVHNQAMALALEIGYASVSTIKKLLSVAHLEAKCLAIERNIITSDTVKEMLAKAELGAAALSSR